MVSAGGVGKAFLKEKKKKDDDVSLTCRGRRRSRARTKKDETKRNRVTSNENENTRDVVARLRAVGNLLWKCALPTATSEGASPSVELSSYRACAEVGRRVSRERGGEDARRRARSEREG